MSLSTPTAAYDAMQSVQVQDMSGQYMLKVQLPSNPDSQAHERVLRLDGIGGNRRSARLVITRREYGSDILKAIFNLQAAMWDEHLPEVPPKVVGARYDACDSLAARLPRGGMRILVSDQVAQIGIVSPVPSSLGSDHAAIATFTEKHTPRIFTALKAIQSLF